MIERITRLSISYGDRAVGNRFRTSEKNAPGAGMPASHRLQCHLPGEPDARGRIKWVECGHAHERRKQTFRSGAKNEEMGTGPQRSSQVSEGATDYQPERLKPIIPQNDIRCKPIGNVKKPAGMGSSHNRLGYAGSPWQFVFRMIRGAGSIEGGELWASGIEKAKTGKSVSVTSFWQRATKKPT